MSEVEAAPAEAPLKMITVMGLDGDVRWVSPSITQLLGWPHEGFGLGNASDLVHPDDRSALGEVVVAAMGGSPKQAVEHRMRAADGQYVAVWTTVHIMPAGDEDLILSVTEAVTGDRVVSALGARYRAMLEMSRDALVVHIDGVIVAASPIVSTVLRYPVEALIGHDVYEFVAPESMASTQGRRETAAAGGWPDAERIWLRSETGSMVEVEIGSCPVMWDGKLASQMTLRPVADVIAEAVRLGAEAVAAADKAVIVTDADRRIMSWNPVACDLYGWTALEAVGRPVLEVLPWAGSDEELQQSTAALRRNGSWHGVVRQRGRDGRVIAVRTTTRVVTGAGGNVLAVVAVNESMDDLAVDDEQLAAEVAAGLERNEFEVWYQPIVRPVDGTLVKVEALVRWRHAERGVLPPAAFLASVERSSLITQLDDFVLRSACRQVADWRTGPAPRLELSVNFSVRDLADEALVERVADALSMSGLPPHALWVEVTETALAESIDLAIAGLERLRRLGVRLALDDFGTGFAHLSQLRRFPVQALKIDQSFVSGMSVDPSDAAIVRSVIDLGRELGLTVIAEGVETESDRDALVALRCDLAQGYLFGRPVPAVQLELSAAVLPRSEPDGIRVPTARHLEALVGDRGRRAEPNPAFEQTAAMASRLCGAPMAHVALFDEEQLWLKAQVGLQENTPDISAFCRQVATSGEPLVVSDAPADARFADDPCVVAGPRIRSYAGTPVVLSDGDVVGTLCVMDRRARSFDDAQLDDLAALANRVSTELELRRTLTRLDHEHRQLEGAREELCDANRYLQAVVDTSRDIVCRLTPEGVVEMASDSVRQVLGADASTYVGHSVLDLIHGDDVASALGSLAATAAELGPRLPTKLRIRHSSGRWVPVEVVGHTLEEHDGQRRIIMTVRDLTGAAPRCTEPPNGKVKASSQPNPRSMARST